MRHRLSMLLVPAMCAACSSAPTATLADPYALNEEAARAVRAGRLGTAEILLERAVLLAPAEPSIRRNRELLRKVRAGLPVPAQPPAPETGTVGEAAAQPLPGVAPLPPLWPAR